MRLSIEGNIGSGKSACVRALAAAFPNVPSFPEPVEEWGELLSLFYKSPAEWALPFSLRVLLDFRRAASADTCVVERSPMATRFVFSQLLYNEGTLNCQEWELFKEYHDILGWKPDVIFYIDTPAPECARRIESRGRPCEADIDQAYLGRIEFQYGNMLRFAEVPVQRFDGTMPETQLAEVVVKRARELFTGRAPSSGVSVC